jgi:membrane fusion protein (multidrug efflux system)
MKGLLCASTVLVVSMVGCNSGTSDKPAPTTGTSAPNAPTTVSTVQVASKKLQTTVALPAQLAPYEQVDIYPKVTGFVQAVTVDRGSRVRRGQLLVRLTAPELASQRSQANAAVKVAESQLTSAQAKLASDNGTYLHMVAASKTPGVLAENDVLIAGQTVSADNGLVEAASQNVAAAKDALRSVSQTEALSLDLRPVLAERNRSSRSWMTNVCVSPCQSPKHRSET